MSRSVFAFFHCCDLSPIGIYFFVIDRYVLMNVHNCLGIACSDLFEFFNTSLLFFQFPNKIVSFTFKLGQKLFQ